MRDCAFKLKVLECLRYGHHRRRFTGSAHDQSGPLVTAAPVAFLYCPWCCCTYRDSFVLRVCSCFIMVWQLCNSGTWLLLLMLAGPLVQFATPQQSPS
jgi:hypothetical protein